MARRSNPSAMGALFLLIAAFLMGIALFSAASGHSTVAWVIALAAAAIAVWFLSLSLRAFRSARRTRH